VRWRSGTGRSGAARLFAGLVAVASLALVTGAGSAAHAAEGDAPVYAPSVAWEAALECGPCTLGTGDGDAIVHESGSLGGGRLRAFGLSTGEERWSSPAMAGGAMMLTEYGIVLHDKASYEIHSPDDGSVVAARSGVVVAANAYGVLVAEEPGAIVGVDLRTGVVLWTVADPALAVADVCRDLVVVVPRASTGSFRVLDQRTGQERWRSDVSFDRRFGQLRCSGWWIYTADGQRFAAYDVSSGFEYFGLDLPARSFEMYREVALVDLDDGSGQVVAIDRMTGERLWTRSAAEIGTQLASWGRLRRDGGALITVHTGTGEVVNRLESPPEAPWRVVGVSETRVTVLSDTIAAVYGLADLGRAWQIDLGTHADDAAVGDEVLLVRYGARLVAYR